MAPFTQRTGQLSEISMKERAIRLGWNLTDQQRVLIRDEMMILVGTAKSKRIKVAAARVLAAMNSQDIRIEDLDARDTRSGDCSKQVTVVNVVNVNDVIEARKQVEDWRQERFSDDPTPRIDGPGLRDALERNGHSSGDTEMR